MLALTLHHHMQPALTHRLAEGYASWASAKSGAGIDSPERHRRTSATLGAFFVPLWRRVRGRLRPAGFLCPRSVNPRIRRPQSIDSDAGDSTGIGVPTMAKLRLLPTRDPSARAAAHKAMAKAALFADSSAAVRLKRFNAHMQKARRLEAVAARRQEVVS